MNHIYVISLRSLVNLHDNFMNSQNHIIYTLSYHRIRNIAFVLLLSHVTSSQKHDDYIGIIAANALSDIALSCTDLSKYHSKAKQYSLERINHKKARIELCAGGKAMLLKMLIGVILGGLLGYLYYKKIGCPTKSCPITSNPYSSTIYGAIIGLMLANIIN